MAHTFDDLLVTFDDLTVTFDGLDIGVAIWPSPGDVRLGVSYGPTGADYEGTMAAGSGTYPTASEIATAVWAKVLP